MSNEIDAALISAGIALAVSLITYIQSRKHHAESYKLSQYIEITQRVFDVDMLFIQNSDLRPYFYESKIVTVDCDIQKITAAAEYILDFYSTLQEHERLLNSQDIPSWAEWTLYIKDGFKKAPFLCYYYDQRWDWYEEGLKTIYNSIGDEPQKLSLHQKDVLSRNSK